jgi:hypothetical protein
MNGQERINKDEKELVIARLKVMPGDRLVSIGSYSKSFSRDQLITEIEKGSEVGKKYVEVQLKFLQAFKDGKIYKELFKEG